MASTSTSKAFVQLTSEEEGNWLSLGRALTSVLCQGLRPFIKQEVENFYKNVTAAPALAVGPCTCVFDPGRKKNQYHDMANCAWAKTLQMVHLGNRPNWKQSDPTKWLDPHIGPWEIAKLFLPDIGAHTVMESVEDMEVTGILNLMFWCNHFNVQRPLIKDVRDIRNTKWVHVPKLELSKAEKMAAFATIEKLLQDPELAGDPGAQRALQGILALKSSPDVNIFKAEVLSYYEEAIRSDVTSLQRELRSLKKESKKNEKQRSHVEGRLRNLQKALEKLEKKASVSVTSFVLIWVLSFISFLARRAKGVRRKSVTNWLILLLLCCLATILDHKSYKDGKFTKQGPRRGRGWEGQGSPSFCGKNNRSSKTNYQNFHGRLKLADFAGKYPSLTTKYVCVLTISRVSPLISVEEAGAAPALSKLLRGPCKMMLSELQTVSVPPFSYISIIRLSM